MSQQFLLPCQCGKQLRVSTAQAGEMVRCECGASLAAPTLRALRALPPAPAIAEGKRRPGWSSGRGVVFGFSLLAVAIGSVLAGYHGVQHARKYIYSIDRTDEYAEQEATHTQAKLKSITPTEALLALREMEEEGLGEKPQLLWVIAQAQLRKHRAWIATGTAAAVCGLVGIVGALYIGRR